MDGAFLRKTGRNAIRFKKVETSFVKREEVLLLWKG